MRFWVGGYTADMDGEATGIGELRAGAADDVLAGGPLGFAGTVAATDGSPSWLTRHPTHDIVYAAMEGASQVQAFRRTGEASFVRHGAPVDAGELVCHVAVAPDGGSLVASCWGDGRVVRMRIDDAGVPSAPQLAAPATDPYAGSGGAPAAPVDIDLAAAARALRDAAGEEFAHLLPTHDEPVEIVVAAGESDAEPEARVSRAHQALFLPSHGVVTTDMGLDLVRFWRPEPTGLHARGQVVLPRGVGPRHMVAHPSGHLYVVTELSREVYVLAPDESGAWRVVSATALSPATADDDLAAEIALSRDSVFLYAGLRGSNTIAALRVGGSGDRLAPVALVDAGVDWPRHHVVVRDTLLVAGQRSDEAASLTLDERTGVPGRIRHRTAVPSPTCLLPVR
ncbi:beta-propeller fold lactonase family protein [Microbacterium sp. SORGH_AS_0888]|uniref:lactonase family protein n=1 Tax=Microbacterium sp. SORGH_AS_0888 TaxID=3041791 RepID=UPI00277E2D52|nr:beta-propeller fold lactonase family protein [Microbacterium sp. SORGH_AS_0888]MDQ1129927.1 6-phosphogluconolactonase [Microbacterium sp. SORGH_AS_0888]